VRLLLGLGNPGERYARTRHNVAWRVLDDLARRHGARPGEDDPLYRTRSVSLRGGEVVMMEPRTFMNASGEALAAWWARHGADLAGLLVVTDDVYLSLGRIRVRARGTSGGHRGLDSIQDAVGSREYARLRIGVGAAGSSAGLREHVLESVAPEEEPVLESAIRLAADAVECWAAEGLLAAMNRFNARLRKEVSES